MRFRLLKQDFSPAVIAPVLADHVVYGFSALRAEKPYFYSHDDMPLFVACVDVAMRLGNLIPWILSINDRSYLSRLDQLCEEPGVFGVFAGRPGCPSYDLLAASPRNPAPAHSL